MKVVFITPSLRLGGYEKVIISYANSFAIKGHDVTILCGFKEGELLSSVNKNVSIAALNARFRSFLLPLIRFLNSNEVDILYAPFRSYSSLSVLAKKYSRNKRVVIYSTFHGFESRSKYFFGLQKRLIRQSDVLITVSGLLADYESRELGINRKRYYVFHNPVINSCNEVVSESHKWLDGNHFVIVTCCRLEKDKNVDIAIKIFAEVFHNVSNARMLIFGEGTEKASLIKLARELSVSKYIDFMGYVSNVNGCLNGSNLLLHTAQSEGFGNVIVEALYCRVPVVTTSCGGPTEIIRYNQFGITIGKSDDLDIVDQGVEAVLSIIDGVVKFQGLHERALEYDINKLDNEFFMPYYDLYDTDDRK